LIHQNNEIKLLARNFYWILVARNFYWIPVARNHYWIPVARNFYFYNADLFNVLGVKTTWRGEQLASYLDGLCH
jgi:hypothetical protein